ncbi:MULTISPECIES: hypothetical protein [Actinomadura]|uniref:Uncharacterized protein n=1 Tax=Actinomadura yumaensis TaxID=111807 RepID=A0ABW2CNR7_9ACTN|nr:hypothetical protein [Actinomadura sp. J1-007]
MLAAAPPGAVEPGSRGRAGARPGPEPGSSPVRAGRAIVGGDV